MSASHTASGRLNPTAETFIAHSLRAQAQASHRADTETYVTHSLRAEGFDASEDGTGRGTPLVPVAFTCKDHGSDAGEISPTLRGMGYDGSHANGGGQVAIAFAQNSRDEVRMQDGDGGIAGCLNADEGMRQRTYVAFQTLGSNIDLGQDAVAFNTRQDPIHGEVAQPLGAKDNGVGIMFSITPSNSNKDYNAREVEKAQALTGGGNRPSARGGDLVMTLAIRGRGDSHNLETRDDGTANAILTPNGGRAGIGVGAVAILPEVVTIHGTDKTANAASMTDVAGSIRTKAPGSVENSSTTAALHGSAVRRLTPKECARLQGFPDDYLDITYRGKPAADGPKYKALGNSMATPVMRWIGERIALVDAISNEGHND